MQKEAEIRDPVIIGNNTYSLGNAYQSTVVFCADLNECLNISAGGGIQQYNIGWNLSADGTEIACGSPLNSALECGNYGAPYNGEIGYCEILGCIDDNACNYNIEATLDDESCIYPEEGYNCDGICYDYDGDGVCYIDEVYGCTNPFSFNFSPENTEEDGSCIDYIYGCTDVLASNYNQEANTDDGSCEFGPWEIDATDCNMTVLLPDVMNVTLEGETITESWIAVSDSEGNIYGSAYWTAGTTTSIAVWGAEAELGNGMDAGETLNWWINVEGENISGSAFSIIFSNY